MMDTYKKSEELLANIKSKLPELKEKFKQVSSHWEYEDAVYRFYHQSFKVYRIQGTTQEIVEQLESVAPKDCQFCSEFKELLKEGASGKAFKDSHNKNWTKHTRPMVEAFFHAKYFLEMAVKYGEELDKAPELMPSGWAALLSLYNLY